ncbi:MAG: hypothetical protein JNM94_05800 [Phycisphaerae bacterium]|nr:hypothetical protein [Phycisphaerae bacterium]
MTPRLASLANEYLDGTIDADDAAELSALLERDADAAASFARLTLLHDALSLEAGAAALGRASARSPRRASFVGRVVALAALVSLVATLSWFALKTEQPASAGEIVARLVAANAGDRTYVIRDLSEPASRPRETRSDFLLDGAIVSVRSPNSYALKRTDADGNVEWRGSDGHVAWVAPGDGPARVSNDLHRFAGALPGSQTGVPFIDPHDGLSELDATYRLNVEAEGPTRSRIVGVRRADARGGPRRIEITYDPTTNRILTIRLDQLPQARGGPRAVAFELLDDAPLPDDFYGFEAHRAKGHPILRLD